MKASTSGGIKKAVALVLSLAMLISMLPMQVQAEGPGEQSGHVIYRLPAGAGGSIANNNLGQVATTTIDYGHGAREAFIMHPATSIGTGGWVQAPFGFALANTSNHGADFLDYVYAISFTLHVPAEVIGLVQPVNPPMIRFDSRVLPISDASAMEVNVAGLFQTPYEFNIVPSVFTAPLSAVTPPMTNTGFWYRGDMDTGNQNFLDSWQWTNSVNGVDYVSFNYTVVLPATVSEVKDEIHFTVSVGNMRFLENVYMSNVVAHFGDEKSGGLDAATPPARIYMDGQTSGHSINNFQIMQHNSAPIVTARGVWGGTQSRLTVTAEGTFATYTHRHPDENLVSGGLDGNPMHGRVVFLFKPAGTQTWHTLYEWPDSVGSPTIHSDAYGNVYVISHMTQDGSHVPGSSASRATFRPWVAKYAAGTWTGNAETTPVQHFPWTALSVTVSNSYTASGFSQDGRLVLGTSGSGVNQNGAVNCGIIDLLVFCTIELEWVDAARVWTGQRFAYKYINFDADGNIEVMGQRNGHYLEAGHETAPGMVWVFDGSLFLRVYREFYDTIQNNYPRVAWNDPTPWPTKPAHPPYIRYARFIHRTEVSLSNPVNYAGLGRRPTISNTSGDVFWDCNGDVHMIYNKAYHGNNFVNALWHTVVRDGEVLFDNFVMPTPRGSASIMFKDDAGNYYIFVVIGGVPLTRTQGLLYRATDTADTGWTWTRVGTFTLPAPVTISQICQAYNVGMPGHGNSIHIMHPVRDPRTAAGDNPNYWAYFVLELSTPVVTPPTPGFSIFNNGQGGSPSIPNAGLAEVGVIRMWTQLNGVGAPIYLAAADTIVATDQNGQCAMDFVRVGRVWTDNQGWANYFNLLDVNKHAAWQRIYLSVTAYGQTVNVVLVNANYFSLNIFNNGPGGSPSTPNAGLAEIGVIRIWTQLAGVNARIPLAFADTIVATDQNGQCAMEFVRVGRVWSDDHGWFDYFNLLDVTKHNDWQRIYLSITVFGQTVDVVLVNANYVPAPTYHTVTFVVQAGAVGVYAAVTTTVEVPAGEEIPVGAIPNTTPRAGFYFADWYPSDPAEFGYVTEDVTFTARFNPLSHDVTFEAGHGGVLVPTSFGLVVRIRDGFTFWADRVPAPVPNNGYEFVAWYPADPAGFVVRENMTFTAVFAPVYVPVDLCTCCIFLRGWAPAILAGGLTPEQLRLDGNNDAVLTLVLDGIEFVLSHNANNRNISGQIALGCGCYLVFDIRGNGSNVREFEVVKK